MVQLEIVRHEQKQETKLSMVTSWCNIILTKSSDLALYFV